MSEQIKEESEAERLEAELQKDIRRWKVRVWITISAFLLVVFITVFFTIGILLVSPEEIKALKDFNSIIITVIGFCSSIVMLFIGAATYSDSHGMKVISK